MADSSPDRRTSGLSNTSFDREFIQETWSRGNISNVTALNDDSGSTATLLQVSTALLKYVTPLIIFTGTVGNALSFTVLMRRHMRVKSVYLYLLLLACADTTVLYLSAFKNWIRVTFGYELLHHSNGVCKSYWFLLAIALHMSAWLIVFLTVDRFLAVTYPLKAILFCTARRAAINTGIGFIVLVLYNGHLFWTISLQHFNENGRSFNRCGPLSSSFFMNKPYNYMKFATYSAIPFLLVSCLNIGIIMKLRKTKFKRDERNSIVSFRSSNLGGTKDDQNSPDRHREFARLTSLLLLVSFSWLFLTFPFTLYSMIPREVTSKTARSRAAFHLITVICYLFLWTNHSINFFLYCFSGQKFRYEIYVQLCRCLSKRTGDRLRQCQSSLRSQRTVVCPPVRETTHPNPKSDHMLCPSVVGTPV